MTPSEPCILVTNDDGYDAPGLTALIEAVEPLGDVVVVAPDREQSGAGHALTLDRPLRVWEVAPQRYRVNGTPTDCVHLAMYSLTGARLPKLVVSGINRGLNMGDDVTYSGTVAGALEGTLLHVPSLAFSVATDRNGKADFVSAAAVARKLSVEVLERGLPPGVLLSVNVPLGQPKGVRVTRQGRRTYRATAEQRLDPSGRPYFWIAGADMTPADEADGDHAALRDGFVSVTPLHADLTRTVLAHARRMEAHLTVMAERGILRRQRMVAELQTKGIVHGLVLKAMGTVSREPFVEEALRGQAYSDKALPIGEKKTISQPWIVARMNELTEPDGTGRVLEIGTGSGYHAAVLSKLFERVYTVERIADLSRRARQVVREAGCENIHFKIFDGSYGWSEFAPYRAIVVTAVTRELPAPLFDQLEEGGRLVLPLAAPDDRETQTLVRVIKRDGQPERERHGACRFVPLVGKFGWTP